MEIKIGGIEGLSNLIDTKIADWNEGQTWKVEEFPHWVWVYGVEEGNSILHPGYDRVSFTGDNIYTGVDVHFWPYEYTVGSGVKVSTNLPWRSNVSWALAMTGSKAISSPEMVWKWKPYQYNSWLNPQTQKWVYWYDWTPISPTIFTRYYDGSP